MNPFTPATSDPEALQMLADLRRCSPEEALSHAVRLALDCERAVALGHKPVIDRGPGMTQVLKGWEHKSSAPIVRKMTEAGLSRMED